MKNSNILVAITLSTLVSGAFAVEATQYTPEPGTNTREEVQAEMHSSSTGATARQYGDATVFVDKASTQTSNTATGTPFHIVQLGDATQFIDQPGVRTRAEVRNETLAALAHK